MSKEMIVSPQAQDRYEIQLQHLFKAAEDSKELKEFFIAMVAVVQSQFNSPVQRDKLDSHAGHDYLMRALLVGLRDGDTAHGYVMEHIDLARTAFAHHAKTA